MRLNGYRVSHRNKWYFIQHGILSVQELALLEFYVDLFCFNPSQPNFGTFKVNFEEVQDVFHCKSDTTVRNWHKRLLEVGFIKTTNNPHVFELICSKRYIGQSLKIKGEANKYQLLEQNQPIETILQSFGIDFQSIGKNIQPVGTDDDEKTDATAQTKLLAKDSYNSDTLSSLGSQRVVVIKQAVRNDAEYQKIYADGGFEKLTPDDMRWIDQNTTEKISIESDKQEQEIVRIYFCGNWEEYQKNILIKNNSKTDVGNVSKVLQRYIKKPTFEANTLYTTPKKNTTISGTVNPPYDQKDGCATDTSFIDTQANKFSLGRFSKIDSRRAV